MIDNFLTINGENACLGVAGQSRKESCFGRQQPLKFGEPIETILEPIPPIDVSALIPVGTTPVLFELRDFGAIAGNTELFLVTNATVSLPTRLTPSPRAFKQAFDDAIAVCRDSINTSARATFNESFTEQIAEPILKRLKSATANKQKIDQIRDQLEAAGQDVADEITDGFERFLKGVPLPSVPRSSEIIRDLTGAAVLVDELKPEVTVPRLSTSQSISEILATGFDPTRLEVSWDDIAATCNFVEDSALRPVFAPVKVDLNLKRLPDGSASVEGSASVKGNRISVKAEVKVDSKGTTVSVGISGTF